MKRRIAPLAKHGFHQEHAQESLSQNVSVGRDSIVKSNSFGHIGSHL